ncbi:Fe-S cluster assembly protein SufB [Candidatus Roizmanbacteria bacterium RIFCSPLOWO2_12_FULL_40_12]|uniref:Fe-S cluster assembly protein SufB n=1 Tax=Candidatus Roizmanbacteria bacterium RIFCSPLOWO2_01_FULL_40_42 TaxID=1802066 RepID=A0A1F7J4P3_9BACT|nr:MAG: Fe-S cluster assembly protein SufB [Candidatus Roizmanbacteria bacterium RIFCSPHIGHO2_01_FULL_40_98]OGK27347.1 MAG: Fe-S cluster assembly protein SufB [Candidatus Roizmanbacteria bacterium RIFCSPHIGHO2_02_FULL_40_53]OGK30781.1 MAG: Fe-S cluster assembly protein SufB [Candidatus Roizmanbacteria bacterium RIFCSPHIGHO2_12_41_18]OGK36452.1 MAG: Fe-S cluster assembly protein SufB [Candidatus Roizmanbacteria bacterium RIFCSPHIGHO2_12_FULL_40_130]OGK50580.1 MAG: Fe-S cluster assembly protein S
MASNVAPVLDFEYKFGFSMPEKNVFKSKKGISEEIVSMISDMKQEPAWMKEFRLKSYRIFREKKMPEWGADLSKIDFENIFYFIRSTETQASSWEDLPSEIKDTYDKIGVPEAEKNFLAGVSAQYESEVVYESVNKELEKQGVIFCDMDTGLREHPEIVKKYFGTLIPPHDNKFAALNSAVWSGGSFVYVPKGVKVTLPLQAYFRINAERFGQFERTLIIAEEGSYVHYIEGCTAPIYTTQSLHSAVVEIFVKKGARVRYTTVQNWSKNIYNLVTKRAKAEEDAVMEWVDCNLGSGVTMKYPSVYLTGRGARGEVLSIAFAGKDQHQDAGAKMLHLAPNTSSRIVSKSISKDGGRTSYRGLIVVHPGAKNSSVYVSCDALILDEKSRSDTYPYMKIKESDTEIQHEATVEKLGEEKLFYLTSRGISKADAEGLLVNGFIEPITKEIPLEYSVELNRLINLEMIGSVG